MDFDSIGWIDVGDTDSNGSEEFLLVGFATNGAYSGCEKIDEIAANGGASGGGYGGGWHFEVMVEGSLTDGDSLGIGFSASGDNTGELLAFQRDTSGTTETDIVTSLAGNGTMTTYSTSNGLVIDGLSLAGGGSSLAGSFTACTCSNLDVSLMAPF